MPDANSLPDEPTGTSDTSHTPAAAEGLPDSVANASADASAEAPVENPVEGPGEPAAQAATDSPAPRPAVPELSPAACAARLAELFPALFGPGGPRPLKLRIQADIQQRAPGQFTKKSLSIFLHRYTTGTPYLIALSKAPARIDLDGQPAGELAAEHREAAVTELARRRAMHEARRAAENAARREAEAAARQQHAAQADARRDRAALLRAFETTTLTPANFCALKRMSEADLQAALTLAREERAERPPEPRQDQRPDPRHDNRGPRFEGRREGGGRTEGKGQGRPRNPGRPARPGPR
jgi:sRNA-binding protein